MNRVSIDTHPYMELSKRSGSEDDMSPVCVTSNNDAVDMGPTGLQQLEDDTDYLLGSEKKSAAIMYPMEDSEPKPRFFARKLPISIHIYLILAYTAISAAVIYTFRPTATTTAASTYKQHFALPYLSEVGHEVRRYQPMGYSKYVGPPSQELEDAWDKLLLPGPIRVTREELTISQPDEHVFDNEEARLARRHGGEEDPRVKNFRPGTVWDPEIYEPRKSIPLPNGGVIAWLGGLHELHCVKMLYEMIYLDYYHPNITTTELEALQFHADHCVDQVRESIMCRPDLGSLTSFEWVEGTIAPLLSDQRPRHQCVDWEDLSEKLLERHVSDAEFNQMMQERVPEPEKR